MIFALTVLTVTGLAVAIEGPATHLEGGHTVANSTAIKSKPLPLPRDPDIAVQEEFDAAVADGTEAALLLFIQRHGDHRLAEDARQRIKQISKAD